MRKVALSVLAILIIIVGWSAYIMLADGWVPTKAPPPVKPSEVRAAVALSLAQEIHTELDRGWMPNDTVFWPTYWLFNYQNFQLGEREVWYRVATDLRDHLSRVRKTDAINTHLDAAVQALNNDPMKWWFPSYESRLAIAQNELGAYARERLANRSIDYALERADNLRALITDLASVLGGTQDRLVQAASANEPSEAGSTGTIPYCGLFYDSAIFYRAKGEAYAALVTLEAVKVEYADILERKRGTELVNDAIFNLREAINLRPLIVLNSGRASLFANHLNNLLGPFALARAKVNSLIDVLQNG